MDGASVLSDFSVANISDPKIIKYKSDSFVIEVGSFITVDDSSIHCSEW